MADMDSKRDRLAARPATAAPPSQSRDIPVHDGTFPAVGPTADAGRRARPPAATPTPSGAGRIGALDMLRGFALVCIMLNHMPIGVARNATLSNFFLFDAAELFVLLSGFLVGLVWRRMAASRGTGMAQRRFAIRAFQVWRAMLIAAVVMAGLSLALLYLGLEHTAVWNGYADLIWARPLYYLLAVGGLWMQPNLLDVLALYTILLATTPLVMPALAWQPRATAVVLVTIWWFAVPLNEMLPNERPGPGGLLFNPFGWQALFFTGAGLGLFRQTVMARLRPFSGLLTLAAVGVLIFGALVLIGWRVGEPLAPLRNALFRVHGVIDKWPMDGARYLSILAAAWLVAAPLAGLFGWLAGTGIGRGLATIGRGGLVSFVACVLLSVLGDAVQMTMGGAVIGRLAVDLWTLPALWVVAEMLARFEIRRAAPHPGGDGGGALPFRQSPVSGQPA